MYRTLKRDLEPDKFQEIIRSLITIKIEWRGKHGEMHRIYVF